MKHRVIDGDAVRTAFHTLQEMEREVYWYRNFPWAAAPLLDVRPQDLTITVERGDHIESPDAEQVDQLAFLLQELGEHGVHHRDVHPGNIVLVGGEVRLIDWETAISWPGVSYDLFGPVDVPVPMIHGGLLPQWWNSNDLGSIKSLWKVDVPRWVFDPH